MCAANDVLQKLEAIKAEADAFKQNAAAVRGGEKIYVGEDDVSAVKKRYGAFEHPRKSEPVNETPMPGSF